MLDTFAMRLLTKVLVAASYKSVADRITPIKG